ncbi:MAG: Hpt domain-containing protein [Succinivibrio sp.]|nr:Hpt domain-containing protein [Succinivibrio sp.]
MSKLAPLSRRSRLMVAVLGVALVLSVVAALLITRVNSYINSYLLNQVAAQAESYTVSVQESLQKALSNLAVTGEKLPILDEVTSAAEFLQSGGSFTTGLQDAEDHSATRRLLPRGEYPEINSAFKGNSAVGYHRETGLLFAVPVYNGSSAVKFVLYGHYAAPAERNIFLPKSFGGRGIVCLRTVEGAMAVSPQNQERYEELMHDDEIIKAIDSLSHRLDRRESEARFVSSKSGNFYIFEGMVPHTRLMVSGIVSADYLNSHFSGLTTIFLAVFSVLLVLIAGGQLMMHLSYIRAERKIFLEEQRDFVERCLKSMSAPVIEIVDLSHTIAQSSENEEIRRQAAAIDERSREILNSIEQLRQEAQLQQELPEAEEHLYTVSNLVEASFLGMETAVPKPQLRLAPGMPAMLLGDEQSIGRLLNSTLRLGERSAPRSITLKFETEPVNESRVRLIAEVAVRGGSFDAQAVANLQNTLQNRALKLTELDSGTMAFVQGCRLMENMGGEYSLGTLSGGGFDYKFEIEQGIKPQSTAHRAEPGGKAEAQAQALEQGDDLSWRSLALILESKADKAAAEASRLKSRGISPEVCTDRLRALQALKMRRYGMLMVNAAMLSDAELLELNELRSGSGKHKSTHLVVYGRPISEQLKELLSRGGTVDVVHVEGAKPKVKSAAPAAPAPSPAPAQVPAAAAVSVEESTSESDEVVSLEDEKASGMGFKKSQGLKFAAGNEALYQKFKLMFAQSAHKRLEKVQRNFESQSWSKYASQVGALGKAAASVGAQRLSAQCQELERAARDILTEVSPPAKKVSYITIHHNEMIDLLKDTIAFIEENQAGALPGQSPAAQGPSS